MRGARKAIAVGVAVAVACGLQKHLNFVPGPRHAAPVAAAAASMMMAPAAFADEIGDAAKKLGDASYSFAKEVDWNNGIFLQAPGKFQPLEALKAIDKMIEMGAAADPKLLKDAAEAHHKAIGSISGPNGVTSRADWDAVNAAIGRVVASVPNGPQSKGHGRLRFSNSHHGPRSASVHEVLGERTRRREGLPRIPGIQGCC